MASDTKKSIFKITKVFAIAASVTMGMAVMPVFADVATWFPEAHNTENLRIKALQNVMEPYTGWIPRHMGLTEEPGLFTPFVDAFIGRELTGLKQEQEELDALSAGQQNDNYSQTAPNLEPDITAPSIGDSPMNDSNPFGDSMSEEFMDSSLLDENSLGGAADLFQEVVFAFV